MAINENTVNQYKQILNYTKDILETQKAIAEFWNIINTSMQAYIDKTAFINTKNLSKDLDDVNDKVSEIVGEWERINAQIDYGHKSIKDGLPLLQSIYEKDKECAELLKGKVILTEEDLELMKKVRDEQERINELQQTVASNIMPQIINQTGGLIGDVNNLSEAIGSGDASSIAGAWISVLDTVSQLAFQMYEIVEATGDWGEAMETTISGIIGQIPIVGRWVAELIDKLWETDTEKREKALKDIGEAEAKFQHDVAMGRIESTQKQIDHYEKHLKQLKKAGADIEEIRSAELKILGLRERQTAELERQRKVIRDNLKLQGDFRIIAEENIKAGVEWLEKQEQGYKNSIAYWEGQKARSERLIKEQQAIIAQGLEASQFEGQMISQEIFDKISKTGGGVSWAEYQRAERIIQNHSEAIEIDIEKLAEQQALLEGVQNELANYGDEMVRLEIQQFKHRKAMGETTAEEELAFYEMILEKMRERNDEIEADIQQLLSEGMEFTHADIQALQDQLFSLGEIYSTEEQILKLNENLTAEMEKQAGLAGGLTDQQKMMVDQLKQQIELGYLDVANIADVGAITGAMQGMGLAGMSLLSHIQGLGVSGLTAQQVQNLNLVINNTQATPDMMGRQAANVIGKRAFG